MANSMEQRRDDSAERVSDRWVVTPPSDVYENQDEYLICADLPGVTDDGLEIHLDAERLTIRGRADGPLPAIGIGDGDSAADYERRFVLPDDVDRDKVSASLERGVLELHLAKSEASKPRRISIGGGQKGGGQKQVGSGQQSGKKQAGGRGNGSEESGGET